MTEPTTTTLAVNELFGPTFQGEGTSTGKLARFLRLYGCNLACTWCDTPQTWDRARHDPAAEQTRLTVDDILAWLRTGPSSLLVVTGGEPLLQQRALEPLFTAITAAGLATEIEVETSGTITPTPDIVAAVTRFTVSPKLAHSTMVLPRRIRPAVIRQFVASGKASWKFVVQTPDDLAEVEALATEYGLDPVWIMPEGTDSTTILDRMRLLADPVLARGWNLTSRLHILLWGNVRAR
ncbi:7-carboxy-7-deazaguanine synthase QueE [Actinokineospora sp. NBRC 105648]|uniref:7-carboxy-7-deazaguanine synthase QueE n=1 Tax=Actinokineospora sp. NBRC 105648 TaxID=3032206 RepID=UPI0024A38F77|nr:7-carboxy-7-deazaguanine synthase QueE [Actinokineospora sp. NBRC 105648]GLZ37904.1 7-carboxy-7-deazaguanine synthase [Actinokineospora sp. NBRC 105648]